MPLASAIKPLKTAIFKWPFLFVLHAPSPTGNVKVSRSNLHPILTCFLLCLFACTAACSGEDVTVQVAFRDALSDVQVHACGEVERLLADDLKGSRHQRFIMKLEDGQTLLIAHNIDLAPRVPDLDVGEPLCVYGEYEWNRRGGVVHWTHHDPGGRHPDGWIEFRGKRYQ